MALLLLAGCSRPVGLERPNGVALAPDGSLYVMDFGNYRVVHMDTTGRLINTTGDFGTAAEQVYFGWDMASDSQGNIYFGSTVRDDQGTRHDGVKVFAPDGTFQREIGASDYDKNVENTPFLPYGVEVDSQGRVYTADYGANTVRIFSPSGDLLLTLSGAGSPDFEFTNPGDVAIDDQRSLMYITDFTMGKLLQFNLLFGANGQPQISFVKSFGEYGREPGAFAFPQNLAVDDASGTIYVGDLANRRIQSFDSQGRYLASYAPPDVTDWQVLGLAAGRDGLIYAGDALNNAVWIFSGQGQTVQRVEVKP